MNRLEVIGAGPGAGDMLTLRARAAIDGAQAVWCAERTEELVPEEKRRRLSPFSRAMDDMEAELQRGVRCAVLLSGDTGVYSMLSLLKRRFGAERLRVQTGVGSLMYLCASLGLSWQDARILSGHGRALSPAALCHEARTHCMVLLLMDGERDPRWARRALDMGGLQHVAMTVGERLSYENEVIAPFEDRAYDPLCAAVIENPEPEKGLPPVGLEDEAFIRGKTPMTKKEIRSLVLSALRLTKDAVVWDVGAGTGSVSVECARQCPWGYVYAVEKDGEALSLIGQNRDAFHLQNMEVVPGRAPEALSDLPAPTHVFLGGTGGESREIMAMLKAFHAPIRVCATAVTMETAQLLTGEMGNYADFSASQVAVSRLERVGHYRMFRAQNPVFVFSCTI